MPPFVPFKAVTRLAQRRACSAMGRGLTAALALACLAGRIGAATPVSVTAGVMTAAASTLSMSNPATAPVVGNGLLLVRALLGAGGGVGLSQTSGVWYNNVPLVLAHDVTVTVSGSNGPTADLATYYLVSPPAGSHSLDVTLTAFDNCNLSYVFYQGVDPANPLGNFYVNPV
ncbi:MAG TPA: hypothetical protein VNZ67_10495, partial [bacterium]|nr:hypothetical protein [bacterium]